MRSERPVRQSYPYKYEYDANNNLSKLTCTVAGSIWATTYMYDGDNRPTVTKLYNNKQIINAYDRLGRLKDIYIDGYNGYNTKLTYHNGAGASTTALVSTYKNGGDAKYNYTYDANGNITQIWRGECTFASASEKYSYSYDAANQLIRENLYYGAGNSNNATYTYTYDSWGNILTKKQHAYSTGSAGHGIVVANYGYTNSTWKDQLTSYNNQSITYDAMGNPISYLGATLSWNGKQLTGYSKGGTNVTYAYNEDGLRTQKTYNGTTTNYYYNGSVLIGMQSGNTVQRFSYDAQGKVVSVNYNGTEYYYLRNAQGDIVKLIDNNKNTVVEYTYDSWGKLISTTGSLATSLGKNQPFRYRGYVYDTETQWYYLQSRYYDPNTCRFISSDVYLSTGQGVIGHNSYAYCLNNPVNGHDSDGHRFRPYSVGMTDTGSGKTEYHYAKEYLGGEAYYSIESAVLDWCRRNIPLSRKDHRERGGIIVSVTFKNMKYYSVTSTITGVNGTCWNAFVFGSLEHMLCQIYEVEGFVHTHTAYPPGVLGPDWDCTDGGPSKEDYFLFSFPWIKRQFIGNELGGVYEFYINRTYRMIWGGAECVPEKWVE